jgi:peptide/nickel transport system permease protein
MNMIPDSGRLGAVFTAGLLLITAFCLIAVLADFLSPYDYRVQSRREPLAPPTALHFQAMQGTWHYWPFIHARQMVDPLERRYVVDPTRVYPIEFYARGYSYRLLGVFASDRHLFGVRSIDGTEAPRAYLLGSDALGRDRLSRLLIASRFSLSVAPIGTLIASALGILLGCLAGYAGRWTDALLMRGADTMMALPPLVLILAARAAFPLELPPMHAALLLVVIFVVLGWAEMARLARGLVIELRQREFVLAATSIGLSPPRILFRHILPNAANPLIIQAFLTLPAFLLAETALSFLGVGLQEPEPSWGNMLAAAADVSMLGSSHYVVALSPALAVSMFVLSVHLLRKGVEERTY